MPAEPRFRTDLYRGTARWYDEFRVPYPPALFDDLRKRAQISGTGRLLDLACGTGQITYGLCHVFTEVWAVDQEPETIDFAREKAARLGAGNVRWIAGRAEDLQPDGCFELVAIGNAFHRLRRQAIATAAFRWLAPGGHLALLWCNSPWTGSEPWQVALAAVMQDWTRTTGATDRVPAGWERAMAEHPHAAILTAAGFTPAGTYVFPTAHEWTAGQLAGFMYSTSVLSRNALGGRAREFEADLRERLAAVQPDGVFREHIRFAYDLLRRP